MEKTRKWDTDTEWMGKEFVEKVIEFLNNKVKHNINLIEEFETVISNIDNTFLIGVSEKPLRTQIKELEQEIDLLKSIVKLDHPEIEKVKHLESGLTVILDKCVESKTQENAVLKEALKLTCKDLSLYEDITSAEYKAKCYIEQAKESMK